jgi:hypothetical protein
MLLSITARCIEARNGSGYFTVMLPIGTFSIR